MWSRRKLTELADVSGDNPDEKQATTIQSGGIICSEKRSNHEVKAPGFLL